MNKTVFLIGLLFSPLAAMMSFIIIYAEYRYHFPENKTSVKKSLGIDPASSEFYKNGVYNLAKEGKPVTSKELKDFYIDLKSKYPIISMENIFAEDDWDGFRDFTALVNEKVQITGDDLYVTNIKRLQKGIESKTTNPILIKLNQIGTLTETIEVILMAHQNKMSSVVSHRSGETEDLFIADFAVAMGTGQIKLTHPVEVKEWLNIIV